jgi:hypothetical protein
LKPISLPDISRGGHGRLSPAISVDFPFHINTDTDAEWAICSAFLRVPKCKVNAMMRARGGAPLDCRCSSSLFSNTCSQTLGCHFLVPAMLGESWQHTKIFARYALKIYGSSQCNLREPDMYTLPCDKPSHP